MTQRERLTSSAGTGSASGPGVPVCAAHAPDASLARRLARLREDFRRGKRGPTPPPDSPPGDTALLTRLLNGTTDGLEPVRPGPIDVFDQALDAVQREAVARALGSPDVFLLQGLPGTGKSRVVAEIVRQAAVRG